MFSIDVAGLNAKNTARFEKMLPKWLNEMIIAHDAYLAGRCS